MDIYDSRYFSINKMLLSTLGLWPYDTRKRLFIRTFCMMLIIILHIPQVISISMHHSNLDIFMENIIYLLSGCMMFLKVFTLSRAEKQMQIMFSGIAKNWQTIVEDAEIQILHKYSERGRAITIVHCCNFVFYLCLYICFSLVPITPVILNKLHATSEPLPYIYILKGEFLLEDNDAHYFKIYFWDLLSTFIIPLIISATETTYAACIDHCLGLFAIVRYRVRKHGLLTNDPSSNSSDSNYEWIIETVKLHQRILQLTETLEESYSTCFFYLMGLTITVIPLSCNLILVNLNNPIQAIRFGVPFGGLSFILFNLCWPGQQLIDFSSNLFQDAYYNEWYTSSNKSNKMLIFFMLRCIRPCKITAGGVFTVNFETFYSIMRKAISYIAVLSSIR